MLVFLPLNKVIRIFLIHVMFLFKNILANFYSFWCQAMILFSAHFVYYLCFSTYDKDVINYESEFHLGYLSAMYISFLKSS